MKRYLTLAALLCSMMTSCVVGDARRLQTSDDLNRIDLDYLLASAKPTNFRAADEFEDAVVGLPLCFFPAVIGTFTTNRAIYGGEPTTEAESGLRESRLSGFEHDRFRALGLGLIGYSNRTANWNTEGEIQSWSSQFGLGWGLLFQHRQSGRSDQAKERSSTKLLKGLVGYSEGADSDYLHLLWLPIPLN